jgi:DNA-binding Xre family transcriptional regulator
MVNPITRDDQDVQASRLPNSTITPESFIPLVIEILNRDHIKHCELARRTGISESKISRILGSRRSVDSATLNIILDALHIDPMRALLALGQFGDWQQYFDLDVEVIADLIGVLPACLTKARSGNTRQKISLPGTIILAERLSDMIATNDREVAIRQRERPIAGL